jgi:hypothetical protein
MRLLRRPAYRLRFFRSFEVAVKVAMINPSSIAELIEGRTKP